jgi:hypothetical protein
MSNPLSRADVLTAIDRFTGAVREFHNGLRISIPGLCWAFCTTRSYEDTTDLMKALGGRSLSMFFWPYVCDYEHYTELQLEHAINQRMMYLAFLLTWIENDELFTFGG